MGKYQEKCVWVEISKIERFIKELKREAERERNTDKPMNANQVADFLGIHRYEVYRMITDESLPVLKLGPRKFRFDKDEVKKWIKARTGKNRKGYDGNRIQRYD